MSLIRILLVSFDFFRTFTYQYFQLMKKFYTLLFAVIFLAGKSQTATNFNLNDCSGNPHDLFTELNSGKVIVLCWVMPYSSCIGPSLSAYTTVQTYQSSNPNKVYFYLVDDYGNTTCSSLNGWAVANSMPSAITFSNTTPTQAISMSDYGSAGMPKIVVLGGASHTVFDNQINTLNTTQFTNAINQAITASSIGIEENTKSKTSLSVFPNPSNNEHFSISYSLSQGNNINIEVYNVLGAKVKSIVNEYQNTGKHEISVEHELKNGIYLVKFTEGNQSRTQKLVINR